MAKEFVVRHTMLGVINPETGDPYREGDVVPAEHLGDAKNHDRLVKLGAIEEKSSASADKREEVPGSPSEAEELALEQSKIVDLDPSAAPEADHLDLTPQALNADQDQGQGKGNNKGK